MTTIGAWDRLVLEFILGRPLREGERVLHLNGLPYDNRPENLEVRDDRLN